MNKRIPHSRLIIFTRYPEPGKAKTRLIPALGPDGAADLHRQMTEKTVLWARGLVAQFPITLEIRFAGGGGRRLQRWLGDDLAFVPQRKGNLGERMARAFHEAFQEGVRFAVLIGTDCPGLSASLGSEAFAALRSHDVVLGPATDGGYYLIGLRKMATQLFAGIPWGTENVFSKTLDIATELGLAVHRLTLLDDVDRPEDLPVWEKSRHLKI
jgi:hypothetical protein